MDIAELKLMYDLGKKHLSPIIDELFAEDEEEDYYDDYPDDEFEDDYE